MKLRSEGVTWREIDGEMVILDLARSTYLTTNASGTVLLRELAEERSEDELAQALVTAFGISVEQAKADVTAFLAELQSKSLLASAEGAHPAE